MGPPVVQGAPAVPKMGVRARMSDWSQRRDNQDSLEPGVLSQTPHFNKSLDPQTRSEPTFPFCDLLSPSTSRSFLRMKRSNSEVTISDFGAEDVDPAAINPNTGASLRRKYGSTSTLDRQSLSQFMENPSWRVEQQEPSAPPPLPEPPQHHAMLSPSLQTAARISCGDIIYVPNYVNSPVYVSHVQKTKPETSILSRLRNQKTNRDITSIVTSHKCFSHYDVQSVLFNFSNCSIPRPDLQHRGKAYTPASMVSHSTDSNDCEVRGDLLDGLSHDEDEKNSFLVCSSPLFRNEIGGETERRLGLTRANISTCNAAADASFSEPPLSSRHTNASISVLEFNRETQVFHQNLMNNHGIEHIDLGAKYYLKYFYNQDHQNYFGIDKNFGPVSLSIQREKLEERKGETQYNYRMILRTSQLSTLRGSIVEDSVPSSSKHGTSRGLPLKDVLEFVVPEFNIQSLRLATSSPRVPELLLQLDQQELSFQHKVGVLFCRAGQSTEEDMYNNESGSPALDQFLDLLGHRVPLKDATGDSARGQAVFTTFKEIELMFHVSTLLPFTANDPEQLLRKRFIRNNIVTVIFQEPDAPPFSPQNIHSHFQYVFIIVRVHRPCSQHTCYSVAVSRRRDVPSFGPLIPPGWIFPASPAFRNFLLMKIINAENAVRKSETFITMATQCRQEHLKELVENFSTSTPADSSSSIKLSFISLGGKKKERSTPRPHAYLHSAGALAWSVTAKDFDMPCQLAISNTLVVLIEEASRQVAFHCYCRDVIGWSTGHKGVKLFYEYGDCVMFSTLERGWETIREITQRLQLVTHGGPAADMTLRRNHHGQLGFHVNFEGVVAEVETDSFAWKEGLRPGCRLMEICGVAIVTLSHEQIIDLLRTSTTVSVVVILPHRDGTPHRSFSEIYRVPRYEYKLDSDVTSYPFRVTPPTWHKVLETPPTQPITGEPEQQLRQIKQSSSCDMNEGSRSPSKHSTSSDPGPPLTPQTHSHSRALPDWSISSDESSLERIRKSEEASYLHHHPHHVTKALRVFQPSLMDAANTLSSSSSEGRHSDHHLTDIKVASMDSGIDSTLCTSSALPAVAGATLVLKDIQGGKWTTSAGHMTNQSETCSLSSDSHGSTNWSEDRYKRSSSANSPAAFITCREGSTKDAGLTQEGEGLKRCSRLSCAPVTDVSMKQSDVTTPEKPIRVSGVQPPSPWKSLTRTMSHDMLYRTLFHSSQLMSDLLLPHHHSTLPLRRPPLPLQRSVHFYSDSLLALRCNMAEDEHVPLPQASSQLDWYHLDGTRAFKAADVDVNQMHRTVEVTSQSSVLEGSDTADGSLSGKVLRLEEILHQLQLDLLKEQQDKAALQQQVLSLRQENRRLQEESQSAAEHIRRFTTWMLRRDSLP
ncbi:signal-induced proliferation-associated 1-like protein 2 [Archocentrus centrarchus]|uniref:signal-induced proliferation-associated 1-like protein 2 n=1 Tax=Archocentrus centrarchus TaxID=63155 RepID=UPI0011E9E7F3|nr:signal-induced proliferation-associated 1-like protein 2 [Archocentrus centrarchus]